MREKVFDITADRPILHLPVLHTLEKWYVKVTDAESGEQLGEFHIGLSGRDFSYYYPMYLYEMVGKKVRLSCDDEQAPADLFEGIIHGSLVEDHPTLYPNIYKEKERQQVHFSSRRGWLNDPNGLFYDGNSFHLYYQHNPYGPYHSGVNISWGHATSRDLVRFKELHDGIRPQNSLTHIASGSAVVDEFNISGKGKGTVIAAYTAHASAQFGRDPKIVWSQMLVYSKDGGNSFVPFEKSAIISVPDGERWRDPKLFFTDDKKLCIAVFERFEEQNCVSFYTSDNCIDWKFESRTMDLYECPDLFRVRVDDSDEYLWVLYGANGMYRVGVFEDYKFKQIGESLPLDFGKAVYAGQTWNSFPNENQRYHIAWLCEGIWRETEPYPTPFSQSMSLACVLTLHKCDDGYRLYRNPVYALRSLRVGAGKSVECRGNELSVDLPTPCEFEFDIQCNSPCRVEVRGNGFSYDPGDRTLTFTSGKSYRLHSDAPLYCRVVADVRSVEFFIGGEVSASFFDYTENATSKKLCVLGDKARLCGRLYELDSIWNNKEKQNVNF